MPYLSGYFLFHSPSSTFSDQMSLVGDMASLYEYLEFIFIFTIQWLLVHPQSCITINYLLGEHYRNPKGTRPH